MTWQLGTSLQLPVSAILCAELVNLSVLVHHIEKRHVGLQAARVGCSSAHLYSLSPARRL